VFARLHSLQTTPEQHDLGLEILRDQLLPWLRDSSGFRGLIRLWNPEEAKTLVITLWADEESLRASAEAGDKFGELAAETVGTTRLALEDYEVSLFDVADA
jgi:heme-degrading monooxygenase HmoA